MSKEALAMHCSKLIALGALAGLTLSACASRPALESSTPNFGDAVAANIAAQRVAPTAAQKADTYIPPNRTRQNLAREAYEKGEIADPTTVGTSDD
jgi:hypothetical protein